MSLVLMCFAFFYFGGACSFLLSFLVNRKENKDYTSLEWGLVATVFWLPVIIVMFWKKDE
jgi:hypothetical protein